MTSTLRFVPSPALAALTRQVLERFADRHPKVFAWLRVPDDRYDRMFTDWAYALNGIRTESIHAALQEWISKNPEIPRTTTFSECARKFDRPLATVGIDGHQAQLARQRMSAERIARAFPGWQARAAFTSWLIEQATTDKDRQAARDAYVPLEQLDARIAEYQALARRTA